MSTPLDDLPVVVIGAGPVGLAAAAHLAERGIPFAVLEAGDAPGRRGAPVGPRAAVLAVAVQHRRRRPPAARRRRLGRTRRRTCCRPARQLADDYLQPLADLPALKPHVRYGARVVAVTRLGHRPAPDRRTATTTPFLVRLADGDDLLARAVIDASGTWGTPNVLGASGIPAHGEADGGRVPRARAARRPGRGPRPVRRQAHPRRRRRPLRRQHPAVAGRARRTGARHQRGLGDPVDQPGPHLRRRGRRRAARPRRARHPAARARRRRHHRARHRLQRRTPSTDARTAGSWSSDGSRRRSPPTGSSSATGFRPDHGIVAELRLDLDPILGSTRALAPLIDPNEHSCGTVPPHGVDELTHPEPGFYAIGVKSYGRAPTFLLATGYEQARSVVAALAGDWAAARDVQLDLPETGVCNSNPVVDSDTIAGTAAAAAAPRRRDRAGRPWPGHRHLRRAAAVAADPHPVTEPSGRAGRRLLRLSR